MKWTPMTFQTGSAWIKEDDPLYLLRSAELDKVPDGTTLHTINRDTLVKGVDHLDDDDRHGFLAYGLRRSQLPLLLVSGWETV